MKKIVVILLVLFGLFAAYSTTPDDKTCIIESVKSVWGNLVPSETVPIYYNQFMDVASKSVKINNWIFLKRIQYKFEKGYATVGFGAFKKVITIKRAS